MLRNLCLSLVLLFSFASLTFSPAQVSQPNNDSDLQAMKSDVQRMRVLLNQMRTNLAFVATTQSPLKHQFELEADMWQITLDQMDRRIAAEERSRQK